MGSSEQLPTVLMVLLLVWPRNTSRSPNRLSVPTGMSSIPLATMPRQPRAIPLLLGTWNRKPRRLLDEAPHRKPPSKLPPPDPHVEEMDRRVASITIENANHDGKGVLDSGFHLWRERDRQRDLWRERDRQRIA